MATTARGRTPSSRFYRRPLVAATLRFVGVTSVVLLLLLSSSLDSSPTRGPTSSSGRNAGTTPNVSQGAVESGELASTDLAHESTGAFSWTNLTYGAAPGVRTGFGIAYDTADHYVVLFGGRSTRSGVTSEVLLNDTWTYRDGVWTNITSTAGAAPPARWGAAMAYDAVDGYVLLVGGEGRLPNGSSHLLTDVWSFSGGQWTQRSPTGPNALAMACPGGLYAADDTTAGFVLVLVACSGFSTGGEALGYRAGSWTNLSYNQTTSTPIPTPGYVDPVLVDEPALKGVALFGGSDGFNHAAYNETLLYANGTWTDVTAQLNGTPPGRDFPVGDYDAAYPGFLLFGGEVAVPPLEATNVTWILDNRTWVDVTAGPAPPDGTGPLVWDAIDNASIALDGYTGATWSWGTSPSFLGLHVDVTTNPVDRGALASFSSTDVGGVTPYQYDWSFGDGSTSTNASPQHAYSAVGTFLVNLSLRDGAGDTMNASLSIQVISALNATVTARPDPVDLGIPVNFSAVLTNATGYVTENWSWGDGSISINDSVPAHTFTAVGNDTVTLTATDAAGGRCVTTTVVRVNPDLATPTIVANPTKPALGQLVQFAASEMGGTAPYSYSWAFGDGGTGGNLSSISHIFTTNGPFVTSVTVRDRSGGTATGTLDLSIALNLSILGNWSAGAAPLDVGFASTVVGGVPGYAYAWAFGDGATSTLASPSHEFTTPGFYTATVRVEDREGASVEAGWQVYVAASNGGAISVSLAGQPSNLDLGDSSLVSASIGGGVGGYTFDWVDAGALCVPAGLLSVRCTPAAPGSYAVALEVRDQSGHVASGSTELSVVGGSSVPPKSPPFALSGIQIALVVANLGAIVVLVVVVSRRPKGPRGVDEPNDSDAFAAYRSSVATGDPRDAEDARSQGPERRKLGPPREPDPLSDLE